MTYRVDLLPRAETDFRSIFTYIEERSPNGARRWRQAFEEALARVATNPLACPTAPERDELHVGLRQALFRTQHGLTYRAIFLIEGETIYVLRVRGPGQRPLQADELSRE